MSDTAWSGGSLDFWAVYASHKGGVYLAVNTSQPEPSAAESVIVVEFRPVDDVRVIVDDTSGLTYDEVMASLAQQGETK